MRQRQDEAARPARPTRLSTPGSRCVAQQQLREPQTQALFADSLRALEQQRLRQPAGGERACQPVTHSLMPVQGVERHVAM